MRLVVPYCERQKLVEEAHCKAQSAHLGVSKTFLRLAWKFYWPTMRSAGVSKSMLS